MVNKDIHYATPLKTATGRLFLCSTDLDCVQIIRWVVFNVASDRRQIAAASNAVASCDGPFTLLNDCFSCAPTSAERSLTVDVVHY